MASVAIASLRARIEEISSSIDRQQEVLRELENQKRAAHSELNSLLDPMARLTREIASNIFMHCLPTTPSPDSSQAPMLLLQICRLWRDIALSTPALWTCIHVDSPSAELAELIETWLDRAGALPLSLSLSGSLDEVRDVVQERAGQLQTLEVYVENKEQAYELAALRNRKSLFLSLETLTVGRADTAPEEEDSNIEDEGPYLPGEDCVKLMRAAPSLLECELFEMHFYGHPFSGVSIEPLTHECLQHLRLGCGPGSYTNSAGILEHLTLPALQTLFLSDFDIKLGEFTSFLTRSSPPLRSLQIDTYLDDNASAYCGLLPSLTHLDLSFEPHPKDFPFLKSLARTKDFLPNLCSLTIRRAIEFSDRARFELLRTMLSSRRAQLKTFKLILPSQPKSNQSLDATTVSALRELGKHGMDIHIGTVERNYIGV
ncbi:hypothetical protein B0H11DRAFT_1794825 [Mycena galericulata]|nr:hypothetical protein B0H11DRAFT_1794825 [Mycena galericulata]